MTDLYDVWEEYAADPAFDRLRIEGAHLVPGWGQFERPAAMIVAGSAGATDVAHNRPLAGTSGVVLTRLLGLAGLTPDETYQTCLIKYRPRSFITRRMINAATPYLRQEYSLVRPRCLVGIGPTTHSVLAPALPNLFSVAGSMHMLKGNVAYWPMHHPGFLMGSHAHRDEAERAWISFGEWLRSQGEGL